jgi:outer membrane lipoprotein SlyB
MKTICTKDKSAAQTRDTNYPSATTEVLMPNIYKTSLIPISLALVAACAAHPEPIIDQRGVNMHAYHDDLQECESYAEPISVARGTAKGAAGGAAVGAATGAIGGDVYRGAGYGAIFGATRFGNEADREKRMVVKRCLSGRGYRVLN